MQIKITSSKGASIYRLYLEVVGGSVPEIIFNMNRKFEKKLLKMGKNFCSIYENLIGTPLKITNARINS